MARAGRVILLNGTSSSGKTTIARAFQRLADAPWLRLGIDSFWTSVDARWMEFGEHASQGFSWIDRGSERGVEIVPGPDGQRLAAGMRAGVAAVARAGNDVITDDVLLDRNWADAWAETLDGLETLFVAVLVPLEVLERRERQRGDRILGESRAQLGVVHHRLSYDVEVDGAGDPLQSARAIARALDQAPRPRALERLRGGVA